MEETIANILEKSTFSKKQLFEKHLKDCLHYSNDSTTSTYATHSNVVFKLDAFFKGFTTFINEFGKDKKYLAGVEALTLICDELAIEIDKYECFILFHLRDLGKFRMKETKLLEELKKLWSNPVYKEFKIEGPDFSHALKNLMRNKFINYRRGNMHLNPSLIIRYKTNYSG